MSDTCLSRPRTFVALAALGGVALTLAALAGRVVQIETNSELQERLTSWSSKQRYGVVAWSARRGFILDRRGRILAGTRESPSLFADPALIDDVIMVARQVSAIIGEPPQRVADWIDARSDRRFVWLAHHLDAEQADAIRELDLPGIGLITESRRDYANGTLAAHVLGFVGADGKGLEGIEARYNDVLTGIDGRRVMLRNAARRSLSLVAEKSIPPTHGQHVQLTIDSVLQAAMENALAEGVAKHQAESGVGLVMDPKTGEILAMACVPTFDPGAFWRATSDERRNRAITDGVEPGSIFKPFVGSIALAVHKVTPDEEIFCHNGLYVAPGGRRIHDVHPSGTLSFRNVIVKSSNIGMAKVGERLGNAIMYEGLSRFGFGRPTGIAFPGEADGMMRPLSQWTDYSMRSIPFGQEINATPIQLLTAFCSIVNGGVRLKPKLVRAILDRGGDVVHDYSRPDPVERVLPRDVAKIMTEDILTAVVSDGGGHRAAVKGYQACGKTGTAQIAEPGSAGYIPDAYLASFMGAVPADDPRVAVLVMIRRPNPHELYYGGVVSAPVVRQMFEKSMEYLDVPAGGFVSSARRSGSVASARADGARR